MEFAKLNANCFFKGRLKRRVAIALLVKVTNHTPVPALVDGEGNPVRSVAWGKVIADGCGYATTKDVAGAAWEGRQIILGLENVPISE